MKTEMKSLLNEISNEQTALTKEQKETVACECCCCEDKIFSAADLWNIQRRRKTIFQRKNLA